MHEMSSEVKVEIFYLKNDKMVKTLKKKIC